MRPQPPRKQRLAALARSELGPLSLVYIFLPLSLVLAAVMLWQGDPQTFSGHAVARCR